MKRILLLLICSFFASCAPTEQPLPELSSEGTEDISRFMEASVARKDVPAVVAVVVNENGVLFNEAFGKREVENNIDLETDDLFSIQSMTKPVTSLAVMMLFEDGKLQLDDPISNHLPDFDHPDVIDQYNAADTSYTTQPAATEITIRHLLAHTAGYGYGFSNETLLQLGQKYGNDFEPPLLHQPGTRWTYGKSTRILGDLVAQLSGQTLDAFFRERIFGPLGMENTFYRIPEDWHDRLLHLNYREGDGFLEQIRTTEYQPAIAGDYGLISTASSYAKFLQFFLNDGTWGGQELLSKASIDMMTQNQIGDLFVEEHPGAMPMYSNSFPIGAGQDKWGLGFQLSVHDGSDPYKRSPGSYSWAGLYNTHFWVDPEKKVGAVILMQVLPFYDEGSIKVLTGFEERVYRALN